MSKQMGNKIPSKWKTWHKVVLGICLVLFIIIGIAINSENPKTGASANTLPVSDSTIRKKKIDALFSAWDGAPLKLEKYIKENMNDEASFKHINTVYWDRDSFLMIKMEYSGKNAYNATVKATVMAKTDLEGNVIKIISNE